MKMTRLFLDAIKASLAVLTTCFACAALAQPTQTEPMSTGLQRQYAVSLNPFSNDSSLDLRGVDGRRGVTFGIRRDERIESLRLDLVFSYSNALLEQLSHLNVLLNGAVIEALPLPEEAAVPMTQVQVDVPVVDLKPFNVLELQLIGHYTMDCENPLHADLWAKIDESSRLVFDVQRLQLPDDLGLLPQPFFDPRDFQTQKVSFVLGTTSDKRLEAAGIIASWLGALAAYRGTEFSVEPSGLPEHGHAIVILGPNEPLPGVSLPTAQGPTVAMRTNPKDPAGKLLVVMGRDDDEIRSAAVTLALNAQTLSGSTDIVSKVKIAPRKPYDAPNWLPTDRPVYLGELLPANDFTATGYDPPPISIALRLPPDLSSWRNASVPLNLNYRYTPQAQTHDKLADMTILLNQQYVQRFELGDSYEGIWGALKEVPGEANRAVNLPLAMLDSQAELAFKFNYPEPMRKECGASGSDNDRSGIDPNSTINLSALPHHMAMPNLAAFRTAAFPYSRMADLSETIVILSKDVTHHEVQAFLSVLGKVGQSTGYPATGLTVQQEPGDLRNADILIIEAGTPSELLSQWTSQMPKPKTESVESSWIEPLTALLTTNPFKTTNNGPLTPPVNGIYVAGFESPVTTGRSVIVIAGGNPRDLSKSVQFMLFDPDKADRFQGSLVMISDDSINTLSAKQGYFVGDLGFFGTTFWFLSRNPFVLFLLFFVGAALFAIVLFLSLRARSQRRLLSGTHNALAPSDKE